MTTEFIWLLGGSLMSLPMAKEIKRRGYKLLLTDKNEQCACREYADKFYPISVYDERKNLALAQTWKWGKTTNAEMLSGDKFGQIAAVLCIGCDAGPTVSLVSDYLGLPSVGYEAAKRAKNKLEVRKALNLEHPYYGFTTDYGIVTSTLAYQYPLIIKPVAESGSKGFRVVANNAELQNAIEAIDGEVIIEELLTGQDVIPEWRDRYGFDTSEIALDFFVQDGKVHYANGALRLFWTDMPGIEAGHINPYTPSQEIIDKAQYVAEKLGVTWGPFKCDFKQDKRYGWLVMECASRLSGGFDHIYTCPLATGKDITGLMLDVALGYKIIAPSHGLTALFDNYACALALRFEPGKINGWFDPVANVENGFTFYLVDKEIRPLMSNQDRPLFVIRRGQTMDEALAKAQADAERIKPIYG